MKPFNILPPRIDLVDKAGSAAREWWRWFNSIQEVTDGGASGTIGDLAIQAETQPPHGTDYDAAIADLRKRLETLPRGAGGSVAINVGDLRALILSLPRPRDPQPVIDINVGRVSSETPRGIDPLLALRSTARDQWNGPYVASIGTGLTLTAGVLSAGAASGTVTSIVAGTGLAGGTITTSGTISLDAIANLDVLANTSGGAAAPIPTTVSALIDAAIGSTQGDILYRNASVWAALAPGTSGNLLASGGAAANPSWVASSGGFSNVTVNSYITNGTTSWAKPTGCSMIAVLVSGSGAGGGGGAGAAIASVKEGGSGGGGGARVFRIYRASDVTTPQTITVGVGGTGGNGNLGAGSAGGAGATSSFGSLVSAFGGGKGGGGAASNTVCSGAGGGGAGGAGGDGGTAAVVLGGAPFIPGGSNVTGVGGGGGGGSATGASATGCAEWGGGGGGASGGNQAAGAGGSSLFGGAGGGGGGGFVASLNAPAAGGGVNSMTIGGGGSAGAPNGGTGTDGDSIKGGTGGGGGLATNAAATAGGTGGKGGAVGGGGGGGGGGVSTGGKGGDGGDGAVFVFAW